MRGMSAETSFECLLVILACLLACLLACYTNSRDDQIFSHLILTFCKEIYANHNTFNCLIYIFFLFFASIMFFFNLTKLYLINSPYYFFLVSFCTMGITKYSKRTEMDLIFPFLSIKTGQISFCSKKRQDETNKTDLALYLSAPAKQLNLFNVSSV